MNAKYVLIILVTVAAIIVTYASIANRGNMPFPPQANSGQQSPAATSTTLTNWVQTTDPAHLYSIDLPPKWSVHFDTPVPSTDSGPLRLSYLDVKSPGWLIESLPPNNELNAVTHIVRGAQFEVYVFNQDIGGAPSSFFLKYAFEKDEQIRIGGVMGKIEYFREDDTYNTDNRVIKATLTDKNMYYFRISYNTKTNPDGEQVFKQILNSVRFL